MEKNLKKIRYICIWITESPCYTSLHINYNFKNKNRRKNQENLSTCVCVFSCLLLLSCCWVASVMSDSAWPHRRQPTRLPHPWDPPGKNTGVGCHFLLQCLKVKSEREVAQSRPTLRDPMDGSPPGSSVHGTFQARVLEWGTIEIQLEHLEVHGSHNVKARLGGFWALLF